MKLESIYEKDIKRYINPAVIADQMDEQIITQEIEEYVFSKSKLGSIYEFLNAIANKKVGKPAIWVSGYYGSGKSHFLKYVFYCLNQQTGHKAFQHLLDYVKEENFGVDSPVTMSNLSVIQKKLEKTLIEEIIFNIDTVSKDKSNPDAITEILFHQLNKVRGYNSQNITLAKVEKQLDRKGKLQEFKDQFYKATGEEWKNTKVVDVIDMSLDMILDIVVDIDSTFDKNAIRKAIEDPVDHTIEHFVEELKEYVNTKEEDYRLLFLIDEISQYIDSNTSLLLNLQTIVEQVSLHLNNKVWIICTAQQDLKNLTESTANKSVDFGKIFARFETRITLDSDEVEYITQKRILEKNTEGLENLGEFYKENKKGIENQFVLGHDSFKNYSTANDFYMSYPFVPYQFTLIKSIFGSFSAVGYVGEGVKDTERSILGIVHYTAKEEKEREVGYFISLDNFFNDQFATNLTHAANTVLNNAFKITFAEDKAVFAKRVIKVLFMISNLGEGDSLKLPATVENIALLLINDVNTVKLELQKQVQEILDILVDQNIIQGIEGKYRFYDDEGIKIANAISHTDVNTDFQLSQFYEDFIKKYLKPATAISLGSKTLKVNIDLDDKKIATGGNFTIRFVLNDTVDINDQAMKVAASDLCVNINQWFTGNKEFKKDFKRYCQTQKYLSDHRSSGTKEEVISKFAIANKKVLEELQVKFVNAFSEVCFISGQRVIGADEIKANALDQRYQEMVNYHINSLYNKNEWGSSYAQKEKDLKEVIGKEIKEIKLDNELNIAEKEVNNKITILNNEATLSELVDIFEKSPYGWNHISTLHIVFRLLNRKHRSIYYQNEELEINKFYDKAINSGSRSSIVIKSLKQYDAEIVNGFKKAIDYIFVNSPLAPTDTDVKKMVEDVQLFLEPILVDVNTLKEEVEGYSFAHIVKFYHQKLVSIKDVRSTETFLQKVIEQQEELRTLRDQYEELKDFINTNFEGYKELREFILNEKSNLNSLGEAYEEKVEKAQNYFKDSNTPGDAYPQIRKLIKELKEALKERVENLKEQVSTAYQEAFKELVVRYDALGLSDPHILPEESYVLDQINRLKSISELEVKGVKVDEFKTDNLRKLEMSAMPMVEEPKTGITSANSKAVGTVVKQKQTMVDIDITKELRGMSLNTAEEVEELISKLRNKLMIEIGKNGKIFLK